MIKPICIGLIDMYVTDKLNITDFLELLKLELHKIPRMVPATRDELSELFGNRPHYISSVLSKLEPGKPHSYFDFKFDLQSLSILEHNIKFLLREKAEPCLNIIERYKKSKSDLKLFPLEGVTILKKHCFDDALHILYDEWDLINGNELKLLETFYWLGFFVADVELRTKTNEIVFSLKDSDRESVEQLAEFVGYKLNRIHTYIKYIEYNGKSKKYTQKVISFASKYLIQVLDELGIKEFKSGDIGLPSVIKKLLSISYKKLNLNNCDEDNAHRLLEIIE